MSDENDDKDLNDALRVAFNVLSWEAKDVYLDSRISELFTLPTALEFTREYVAKNRPVVIRRAISHWKACSKWNSKYFRSSYGEKLVSVAVTPNGYADGIATKMPENKEYFVLPEERTMTFNEFLNGLEDENKEIFYIQKQNSNFSLDFPELLNDIDLSTLQFATEAFNKEHDALNFWMGDERAITSLHKDPYENIYCVVSGFKNFTLIPPTEYPKVARDFYPKGIYKSAGEGGKMCIEPLNDDEIEWVSVDPLKPDLNQFPDYWDVNSFEIRVNEGDILYLPSLWYHHVQQSHECIAINFWYDMDYDSRYCYYKMVEKLCEYRKKIQMRKIVVDNVEK